MRLSQVSGPCLGDEAGVGSLTLPGFFYEVCQRYANHHALYWHEKQEIEQKITYEQLFDRSCEVARSLVAAGIGKGSRVGVLMSNRPEWIITCFGIAMAGGVVVALNTFSTEQELAHQISVADIEIIFLEQGVANKNFVYMMSTLIPDLASTPFGQLRFPKFPFLRRIVCVDCENNNAGIGVESLTHFLTLADKINNDLVLSMIEKCHPADDALIFFSSGTTAMPKAIQQTHRAAALQSWRAGQWYQLDSKARFWSANGFFWSGNFAMALGGTLSVGACLVLQRYFVAEEAVELLSSQRVTCVFAWPHQYAQLRDTKAWQYADFSAMNRVDPKNVFSSHPTFNCQWLEPNGYGATETFTFVCGAAGSDITDGGFGPVLPGNTVRIIDQETGDILPWGQTGEIIVKGPTTTRGYLQIPVENTFDENGFFHTQDAGYFTDQGTLVWIGRIGDMIKTGGANVSPAEVDAVITSHPSVQSSFTIGINDSLLGEKVVACVIAEAGMAMQENDIISFVKNSLASYKVPRHVLFFSADEMPMTGSNKIKRNDLKTMVENRLKS